MSLKNSVLASLRWTSFSSVVLNLLRIVQISVLARCLSKEDFGVVAIVMIVIMFLQMFLDLGISPAIIHKQVLTDEELNSLYWLTIAIGIFLFSILSLLSPVIAAFYHDPKISFYIRILALSLIIQSFGKQFYALFEKELRFSVISKIQMLSSFVNTLLSIIMAVIGFKVFAIIIPSMMGSFLSSLLLFVVGSREFYLPGFHFDFEEVKYFLKFGTILTIGGMINYVNSKFDEILIGRLLGDAELGLYSVSKSLVQRPAEIINPIITRVAFPAMSKVNSDIERLKDIYLNTINYVSTVNFFIYTLIFIFSDIIVRAVLGSQWSSAANIVRILAVYFMIRSTANPVGILVLSRGKPHYSLYWNSALFLLIPITIYISSSYGLIGISFGWVLLMLILMVPNWFFLVRPLCGAGFVEYFKQIVVPLVFSVFMMGIFLPIKESFNSGGVELGIVFLPTVLSLFLLYNWICNREFLDLLIRFFRVDKV